MHTGSEVNRSPQQADFLSLQGVVVPQHLRSTTGLPCFVEARPEAGSFRIAQLFPAIELINKKGGLLEVEMALQCIGEENRIQVKFSGLASEHGRLILQISYDTKTTQPDRPAGFISTVKSAIKYLE